MLVLCLKELPKDNRIFRLEDVEPFGRTALQTKTDT